MIETFSGLPRKSSAIFGNLWKSLEIFGNFWKIFGNVRVTFRQVLENLRKSSESARKSLENCQKHCHQYVYIIKRTLHENIKLISSRHRVISSIYYMEKSVLLGTKPLVDSICHFIRDLTGVFSVCHLCECRIVQ